MSLAVARLITPMIAAYFLKSAGHASHGEGKLMDAYMATLRWSLRYDRPTDGVRRGIVRRFFGRFRDHRLWVIGIGVGLHADHRDVRDHPQDLPAAAGQ